MLEKPDLPDRIILAGLQEAYGLQAYQLTFLPLGADVNTAVYRAVARDGAAYFLKLRKVGFDPISVTVPQNRHVRQALGKKLHSVGHRAFLAQQRTA